MATYKYTGSEPLNIKCKEFAKKVFGEERNIPKGIKDGLMQLPEYTGQELYDEDKIISVEGTTYYSILCWR